MILALGLWVKGVTSFFPYKRTQFLPQTSLSQDK